MRVPLVAGEEPTPLERVLVAADSGNGVSAALDWRTHLFINTDLTVHLMRPPEGEWVCLDAVTHVDGLGLARHRRSGTSAGRIGRAAQTLLVRAAGSERIERDAERTRTDHRLLHRHRPGHRRAARPRRHDRLRDAPAAPSRSRT